MKPRLLFFLLSTLLLFSCKRNWVCTCDVSKTTEFDDLKKSKSYDSYTNLTVIKKTTKAIARANCMSSVTSYSELAYSGSALVNSNVTLEKECVLD